MFEHPGRKLVKFGTVLFILLVLVSAILGGMIGDNLGNADIGLLVGIIGGVPVAWISTIFLVAFGELVESFGS